MDDLLFLNDDLERNDIRNSRERPKSTMPISRMWIVVHMNMFENVHIF